METISESKPETKLYFLVGSYYPPKESLMDQPGGELQHFSAVLMLQKTPGGERWIVPQLASVCLHGQKPTHVSCFFEWNEADDTAVLRMLDRELLDKETLYAFCIGGHIGSTFRNMGLTKTELEKGGRGKCCFIPWEEVIRSL